MSAEELVCARCEPVERENSDLRAALKTLSGEQYELSEELAGARATLRSLEAKLRLASRDLSESKNITEIRGVYEHWYVATKRPKTVKLTDDRIKLIRGMLVHFNAADLQEAIDGAVLKPFFRFGERFVYPAAPKEKVALALEQCIGKAKYVEANQAIWTAAQTAARYRLESVIAIWDHFKAVEYAYAQLCLNALQARDLERAGRNASNVLELVDNAEAEVPVMRAA